MLRERQDWIGGRRPLESGLSAGILSWPHTARLRRPFGLLSPRSEILSLPFMALILRAV